MPLIGNPYLIGDTTGNFKLLDDVSSYILTFNPASELDLSADTIIDYDHRFIAGQRVVYNNGGGSNIGGLSSGTEYYIINNGINTIKLASSYSDALLGNSIDLSTVGSGLNHSLTLGFDGVNTKFRATYNGGQKAKINGAAQLLVSINGVLQKPHSSSNPPDGFGIEHPSVIVFSTAPTSSDVFWGNIIANSFPTYDITDHRIDNFIGNNSLTNFTLSKVVPNSQSILVTLDGVVQSPNDTTTRDYSIFGSVLSFTNPPGNNVKIQVRHLGFVGAVSSNVTGFYGRTGNVGLTTSDNVEALTAKIGTGTTFTEDLVVQGDARVTGILTIGTGTIVLDGDTNTVNVGTALTLSHTNGVIAGSSNLHTTGLEIQDLNVSGISSFVGVGTFVNSLYVGDTLHAPNIIVSGNTFGEDVNTRNINASGIITATNGFNLGISSTGTSITNGESVTTLNFVGAGNSISYNSGTKTVDISITSGSGGSGVIVVDGGDFNSASSIAGAGTEINGGEFT
tara:strand:+ start:12604 stop:14130 length:1527 start_codon:yes stop_codon:yes gene_type:complete